MDNSDEQPPMRLKKIASLKLLLPWVSPHRRELMKAGLAIMLVAAALLLLGRGIAYLVDSGLSQGDLGLLNQAVAICIGVTVMLAAGSYFRAVLINRIAERIIADIRKAVFGHVLKLSPGWFEKTRSGDVISTLTSDTTLIQTVGASSLSMAMRNLLVLIGGVVLLVVTSPKLSLVILGVVPLVVIPVIVLGRELRKRSRVAQDKLAEVAVAAEETLSGIATVQAFGRGAYMEERFKSVAESSFEASIKRFVLRGLMSAIVILLVFSAVVFILWMGGQGLIAGEISAGELSSFIFYAALVAASVVTLSDLIGELQQVAGAAERISALLAEKPTITSPKSPTPLPQGGLSVSFDNVSFHYDSRPDVAALSDIDLEIKPSERVALVGPSGAGKSTMVGLILRLFDPSEGRVLVGDVDVRDVGLDELRGAIGFVPQETAFFSGTIKENICFGMSDIGDDAIREAATSAYADEFIEALPDGYDTFIGEKGVRLSGGERQRIAIARALLHNPSVLLLDEATSALDAHSEQAVQEAMASLMEGRTTIAIAHRLATVLGADRIVVIDEGRIIAIGEHDELLASCPLYHNLASLQLVAHEAS